MLSPSLPAKPADSCWAVPVSAIERTLIAISPFVDRPGPAVLERRDRGRLLRRLEPVRLQLQGADGVVRFLAREERHRRVGPERLQGVRGVDSHLRVGARADDAVALGAGVAL